MSNLTPKQQRFVEEYMVDLNATQAAIRAGFSEKTARQQASVFLTKPNIAVAIQNAKQELTKATGITVGRVVEELGTIGMAKIDDDIRPSDKLSALDKLMRHLGGYKDGDGQATTINVMVKNYE